MEQQFNNFHPCFVYGNLGVIDGEEGTSSHGGGNSGRGKKRKCDEAENDTVTEAMMLTERQNMLKLMGEPLTQMKKAKDRWTWRDRKNRKMISENVSSEQLTARECRSTNSDCVLPEGLVSEGGGSRVDVTQSAFNLARHEPMDCSVIIVDEIDPECIIIDPQSSLIGVSTVEQQVKVAETETDFGHRSSSLTKTENSYPVFKSDLEIVYLSTQNSCLSSSISGSDEEVIPLDSSSVVIDRDCIGSKLKVNAVKQCDEPFSKLPVESETMPETVAQKTFTTVVSEKKDRSPIEDGEKRQCTPLTIPNGEEDDEVMALGSVHTEVSFLKAVSSDCIVTRRKGKRVVESQDTSNCRQIASDHATFSNSQVATNQTPLDCEAIATDKATCSNKQMTSPQEDCTRQPLVPSQTCCSNNQQMAPHLSSSDSPSVVCVYTKTAPKRQATGLELFSNCSRSGYDFITGQANFIFDQNFQMSQHLLTTSNNLGFNVIASNEPCQQLPNICLSVLPKSLRPIAIDGSNVAFNHGKDKRFSCKGISLCIEYFQKRGHQVIKAFVPQFRRQRDGQVIGVDLLEKLGRQQLVVFTPSRKINGQNVVCHDDRFILEYAYKTGAVIVSNDNYRDMVHENPTWRDMVVNRLLMFAFADDVFLVPQDPQGRNGPTLDHLLSF